MQLRGQSTAAPSPMVSDAPKPATNERPEPAAPALAVAKWLVPSVTALFLVIGYVIHASHQALLGLDFEYPGTTESISATAEYLRHLVVTFVEFAVRPGVFWSSWWEIALIACLPLLGLVLAAVKRARRLLAAEGPSALDLQVSNTDRALMGIGVIVVTFGSVALYELPLTRIEQALVRGPTSLESRLAPVAISTYSVPERQISDRARSIWQDMVCLRVGEHAVGFLSTGLNIKCGEGAQKTHKQRIDNFYLQNALIKVVVATVSLSLFFRARTIPFTVVNGLILIYCVLSIPYAYGKLVHSTEVERGRIYFKSPIIETSSEGADTPLGAQAGNKGNVLAALILSRGQENMKLYVSKEVPCLSPTGPRHQYEWRVWEGSNTEILAIKDIERRDIIREHNFVGTRCEPLRSPGG